jgi:hypothetical protein
MRDVKIHPLPPTIFVNNFAIYSAVAENTTISPQFAQHNAPVKTLSI